MPTIAQKYRLNFQQQADLSAPVNRALGQQFANADEMFETLFTEVRRHAALLAALANGITITDGVTPPGASTGVAKIYIDVADGDLKIIFGDGTIKTIVVDT